MTCKGGPLGASVRQSHGIASSSVAPNPYPLGVAMLVSGAPTP
jgi:hypothetical protein